MKISQICKKLAELLYQEGSDYNGKIWFDFSLYEYNLDIPYIVLNGNRILIESVFITKDGETIIATSDKNKAYLFKLSDYTDEELVDMNIYGLLSDVYYETGCSWWIGDFELDFLK